MDIKVTDKIPSTREAELTAIYAYAAVNGNFDEWDSVEFSDTVRDAPFSIHTAK